MLYFDKNVLMFLVFNFRAKATIKGLNEMTHRYIKKMKEINYFVDYADHLK